MLSQDILKKRINEIYRCHAIIESYENNTLEHSELTPESEGYIKQGKAETHKHATEILQAISAITGRIYTTLEFIQPITIAYDILKSENFFAARELIDSLLAVYERNFNVLVEKCNISPLDTLRFYNMHFI